MKNGPSRTNRPLVVVNILLLALVATFAVAPRVGAAPAQPDRARGSYTMVSGRIQGSNTDVVYIIDSANQELISLGWDIARNDLNLIGYRNLVADSKIQHGSR